MLPKLFFIFPYTHSMQLYVMWDIFQLELHCPGSLIELNGWPNGLVYITRKVRTHSINSTDDHRGVNDMMLIFCPDLLLKKRYKNIFFKTLNNLNVLNGLFYFILFIYRGGHKVLQCQGDTTVLML